ncbi:MAG: hypothetical protein JWO22_256 [Frankiales bacterium]|nr:hypothetical protein [Frankiales bacterium]
MQRIFYERTLRLLRPSQLAHDVTQDNSTADARDPVVPVARVLRQQPESSLLPRSKPLPSTTPALEEDAFRVLDAVAAVQRPLQPLGQQPRPVQRALQEQADGGDVRQRQRDALIRRRKPPGLGAEEVDPADHVSARSHRDRVDGREPRLAVAAVNRGHRESALSRIIANHSLHGRGR